MITIRQATLDDAKCLLEIYDYYVKNTAITFEYNTPSLAEFQSRLRWHCRILECWNLPHLSYVPDMRDRCKEKG